MTFSSTNPVRPQPAPDEQAPKPALDLSVPKIAGGALAAVTTAFAASFLGVNGTITGAAFGSVVSSVAAALYANSLVHAGSKIRTTRTLVVRPAAGTAAATSTVVLDPADPTALPADLTGRSLVLDGETQVMPVGLRPDGVLPPAPSTAAPSPHRAPARRRLAWKPVLVLAGSAFVLSMAAISLLEGVLGHPVAASSGSGTTISRVVQGGGASSSTAPVTSTSSGAGASSSSSSSSSDSASSSPTDNASPSPSVSPSPSDTVPGSAATDPPTPTPTPTATAAPSSAAGANGNAGGTANGDGALPTQSPVG